MQHGDGRKPGIEQEWPWLDERPVFTTDGRRGMRVSRVPWGAELPPLRAWHVGLVAGLALSTGGAVAGFGLVVASRLAGLGGWWWLALGVPALLVGVVLCIGVYVDGTEATMRASATALLIWTGLLGGVAIGLGVLAWWWGLRADLPDDGWSTVADGAAVHGRILAVVALCAAVACLVVALCAVRGVRSARREVVRILRLRAQGARRPGVVVGLPDPNRWNEGGAVPIRYDDGGGPRAVSVRLNSSASRIPVRGSAVIVFTDGDDLLVELDPERPVTYLAHHAAYESSSGDGGGG
ncbi:MAG TPA: hypothetical protein VKY86_07995 [Promicromonospora sp.]|nr:hypothetical protein [Promicromonospora sp.]